MFLLNSYRPIFTSIVIDFQRVPSGLPGCKEVEPGYLVSLGSVYFDSGPPLDPSYPVCLISLMKKGLRFTSGLTIGGESEWRGPSET